MALAPGSRLGPYEIVSPLGSGGMGEVYRARDPRLGRNVAIKVLPAAFSADPDRLRRFEQEARAAAALNHPNIVTVHEIGTHDGQPYVVSELLEGQTLRDALAGGSISVKKAIDYAIQVCHGLAAAHEKGIVHRDLKPENLFVTKDSRIKILDFGLAKLTEAALGVGATMLTTQAADTSPGVVLGTVGYMSPEQVRGQAVDHRSDIFSLGAILYEMLLGERSFQGDTPADTISAILSKEPPELTGGHAPIPPALDRLVRHALEKSPEQRFQSARDLAFDLREVLATSVLRQPRASYQPGLVIVVVIVMLVTAAVVAWRLFRPVVITSIAVLPFENVGADSNAAYLSDGITATLVDRLSNVTTLHVMARSTVARTVRKMNDPLDVGHALGVEAVITGRVSKRGDSLVVSAELVRVSDGTQLWGEQYSRSLSDLQTVQEELSKEISDRLRVRLSPEERLALGRRQTSNSEAYDTYLRGRYELNRRTIDGFRRGADYFQRAIALDGTFSEAHAGLADCYAWLAYFGAVDPGLVLPQATAAAKQGLAINEQLSDGHASLALSAFFRWDWLEAEREFRRAVELNPRNANAHHMFSHFLVARGRFSESLRESRAALDLEPLNVNVAAHVAWHYYYAGDYARAIEQCANTARIDPNYYQIYLFRGQTFLAEGRYADAIEQLTHALTVPNERQQILGPLADAYNRFGHPQEGEALLRELLGEQKNTFGGGVLIAQAQVGAGRSDDALLSLEHAFTQRQVALVNLAVEPLFDSLRASPRFKRLLTGMDLTGVQVGLRP